MDLLILAQTIFYFTFSLVLIVLGALLGIIVYYIIRLVACLYKISENIENATEEVKDNVIQIFDRLSHLPILSFFLKKHKIKKVVKKKK